MRKSTAWAIPTAVFSVATLAALSLDYHGSVIPTAQAMSAEDSVVLCPGGNATLRGAYMSKGGGTVIGAGPVAFIGTAYFDGKGGVTNPFTVSQFGSIYRLIGKATYTVNSDCTATLTFADDSQHYDMRVSPDGSKLDYIETDPGTVISGSASRVAQLDN